MYIHITNVIKLRTSSKESSFPKTYVAVRRNPYFTYFLDFIFKNPLKKKFDLLLPLITRIPSLFSISHHYVNLHHILYNDSVEEDLRMSAPKKKKHVVDSKVDKISTKNYTKFFLYFCVWKTNKQTKKIPQHIEEGTPFAGLDLYKRYHDGFDFFWNFLFFLFLRPMYHSQ